MKALVLMTFTSLADAPPESWRSPLLLLLIAKDCLLTLVKSRLALGSPGCSWPCRKWPNTQENGCCLPPSDHIQSKILFQTKQDQERGMNGPASLFHSWHWVLFNLTHQVERRYTRMAGTVHAEAHDILAEIEDILVRNVWEILTKSIDSSSLRFQKDEDFTFAVPGQPTWKREEFKVNYPPFRRLVGNFFLCIF